MRTPSLAACALLGVAALGACKREPTFEERYAGAEKVIRDKVGELDKDMARRAAEAKTAPQSDDPAPSGPPGET